MQRTSAIIPFPLAVAHFSLFPLQGLFNFIVYLFPKVERRFFQYKREGIAHPRRFVLAFRDSMLYRGQERTLPLRRRSSLLIQNRARRLSTRHDTQRTTTITHLNECIEEEKMNEEENILTDICRKESKI